MILTVLCVSAYAAETSSPSLELSRPARTWEFLPVVGTRAALLGNESGQMEAWVYPLKIFRDFHVTFHVEGRALPAETLVRTLIVHPESASLVYTGDTFSVRETFFVPVHEPGAVILFDVETEAPLEIEASFTPSFQLEWPAGLGGTWVDWDANVHSFVFGEESKKFSAFVGSPTVSDDSLAYLTNFSASEQNSLRLGVTSKGREQKILIIAASTDGRDNALAAYERIAKSYRELQSESAKYYSDYLNRTVRLTLPDAQLQQAYDWSRISTIQGLVTNPSMGTGLVAGYKTSGATQRPGFAWFFGRDSFWTSLALNSVGDFATTRTALEFISRYQRDDGKIPHEIAQGASFVNWFKDFPYGYASADATPLYIIAVNDYVTRSGDVEFAKQKWDSLWKAYQFLRSTYDAQEFPKNFGFGHGWVEGGPLLPVKTEFYQTGLGVEALRALAHLASQTGKADLSKELLSAFEKQKAAFNSVFWSPEKQSFAFALDQQNRRVDELSVLTTVPMWFGLTDAQKSESTIHQLAGEDHQADWGMRIISNRSPLFNGGGYHYGSVWPLFTGWASVGEYRYHQAFQAYANLRANALLALDGSLGHVAEVLSGDYYQPLSTNSPHQIWSAAMVLSPILRGMFGIETDARAHTLRLAPHIPAEWGSFAVEAIPLGNELISVTYQRSLGLRTYKFTRTGKEECALEFAPALSLRSEVASIEVNGRPTPFHIDPNATDQHATVRVPLAQGATTIRIHLKNDFDLGYSSELPPLASSSRGLRVLSQSWNTAHAQLTLSLSGLAGTSYDLVVWNPSQITSAEHAAVLRNGGEQGKLKVAFEGAANSYVRQEVVLNFAKSR